MISNLIFLKFILFTMLEYINNFVFLLTLILSAHKTIVFLISVQFNLILSMILLILI